MTSITNSAKANSIQEKNLGYQFAKTMSLALAGSLFLALMSQVAIYLPFTLVPVTMQTLAIFLLGGLLGSRAGALSVIAYLVEGTFGLPVFAGGISNPLWFLGAKAGYLIGFVLAAFLVGKITELKPKLNFFMLLGAVVLGEAAILTCGSLWLSFFVGFPQAIFTGVVPFLPGACYKTVSATCLIRGVNLGKSVLTSYLK
jgi:biotin transport system substrate-specific component